MAALHIEIVTLFPEMIRAALSAGVTGRALTRGLVSLGVRNPRDFATDVHHTVDDRPYGGGPGMVMKIEPLRAAIRAAREREPARQSRRCTCRHKDDASISGAPRSWRRCRGWSW